MVNHGRPSLGCARCRMIKKGCDLKTPTCTRCAKRNQLCLYARDPTALYIQDETAAVSSKAGGARQLIGSWAAASSDATPADAENPPSVGDSERSTSDRSASVYGPRLYRYVSPDSRVIATKHFIDTFTSAFHWECIREFVDGSSLEPCLESAIQACGLAALENGQREVRWRGHAQALYIESTSRLNEALRDPIRSRDDQSLITVMFLGQYESLICDGPRSLSVSRTHTEGAIQMLKLRGKEQVRSSLGKRLFRELRAQIIVHCFWANHYPPSFVSEWSKEVDSQTPQAPPPDRLSGIALEIAVLKARMAAGEISDAFAAIEAAEIDERMVQWSVDVLKDYPSWRWCELVVDETPRVWNGMIHAYSIPQAPMTWNAFRSLRIMCLRLRDMARNGVATDPFNEEFRSLVEIRQQLADEICAAVPFALGHSTPAFHSPCVLMTANASIWTLFWAGTCALETARYQRWKQYHESADPEDSSSGTAQLAWIQDQLRYIEQEIGLKWASSIAAPLTRQSGLHQDSLKLLVWFGLR